MTSSAEFDVAATGLYMPECPRWHDNHLWFSDIHGHRVCRIEDDRTVVVHQFPDDEQPAGLGWLPNGDPLVAGMAGRVLYRLRDGAAEVYADLRSLAPHKINDMIVLDDGTALVTQLGFDLDAAQPDPAPTVVIRVGPDASVTVAAEDLMVPNGIAVNASEDTIVVAESGAAQLSKYDLHDGLLTGRVLETLPASPEVPFCAPDGLCLDAQGGRWVADSINKRVIRVCDGVITDAHNLGQFVLACALGGDDRRTLYVCVTDVWHVSDLGGEPTGQIVRIPVDIPGSGRP